MAWMAMSKNFGVRTGFRPKTPCLNVFSFMNKDIKNVQTNRNLTRSMPSPSSCWGLLSKVRSTSCDESYMNCLQKRTYSHHPAFQYPEISSSEAAKSFIFHLDDRGRSLLLHELNKIKNGEETDKNVAIEENADQVSRSQVYKVMMYHGIPFIGFGILDNMIMIIAGEYIDVTIGAALGITTMAAAALGNLVSDLAGVGTAGYVELMACKVGIKPPDLSPVQALLWQIRWSVGLGRGIGITIGCLIGMFPLLFFDGKEDPDLKMIANEGGLLKPDDGISAT